jgi:small subunit ribosomal protein S6e
MGQEFDGEMLGDDFKGYSFRITGGNDKQGFTMKQGVLVNGRVRLLFRNGMSGYRSRRAGERKRKSCRGCIIGPDIAVLTLKIMKKGDADIVGLTDQEKPRRLGPKRAAHIRKVFGLEKADDVRKYVVRREIKRGDKTFYKSPKIQRLVTEKRVLRKKLNKKIKKERWEASKKNKAEYEKVLSKYLKEQKAKKDQEKKEEHERKRALSHAN